MHFGKKSRKTFGQKQNLTHRFGFDVFVRWNGSNVLIQFCTTVHKQWIQCTDLRYKHKLKFEISNIFHLKIYV